MNIRSLEDGEPVAVGIDVPEVVCIGPLALREGRVEHIAWVSDSIQASLGELE